MAHDRPVTIPALGRQGFSLGCLYDLSTHQIYARKLWDEEELTDDKLTIQEYNSSNFSIEISNSQEDRCNALDVDANIKLDIGGGAVVVEGSAKYVNASNSNSQVSSVTYTSKKVTKTKALNMGQLAPEKVTYRSILDQEENATHVISSITYGKNAHFKFESRVTDEEDREAISGRLKLTITAIKAEGEGGIEMDEEEIKFEEETSCEFFGDYSGIVPPLNLLQAKDTILAIERDETNSLGVPIKVTLTPLSGLTNAAMKIVAQLSAGAVNEAARLLQDIEDIQVILKTLENSQTAAEYYEYKTTIGLVAGSYRNRASELRGDLCKILPKIKGTGEGEEELFKVIRDYDSSPFSKAMTLSWLKALEHEVIFVDGLIKLAKENHVPIVTAKSKFEGEKLRAMQGMFYFQAKFLSSLKLADEYENRVGSLRSGGVLDDDHFRTNFSSQFVNFTTAISEEGLGNSDAEVKKVFFLEFMAEENQCDIKFFEMGYDALSEINTNTEIGSVKYDPLDNTVTGEIRPKNWWMGEVHPVSKKGGFIKLQLRYTEDQAEVDQGDDEDQAEFDHGDDESLWENVKDFSHPAEQTSFRLDLGELHGLHEGKDYIAQVRFEIRPGLASKWVPFQFRARERPKVKIVSSSPFLMEVGVAEQIDCIIEKGYPEPTIKWTKKPKKGEKEEKEEKVLETDLSLMFDNPTEENQGVYCVEVENVAGSDRQEILVEVADTIAEKEETLEKIFEKKINTRLREELGQISASVNENSSSIKGNTKSIEGLSRSVSGNSSSISGLSRAMSTLSINASNCWTEMFALSTEFELNKGKLLTTIPILTKEWVLEFCFKPTNFNYGGWTSILHLTKGGNIGSYGDRTPFLTYHPSHGLVVASSISNNRNLWFSFPTPKVGEWTKIQVSQDLLNNKLMFRVIIDGEEKLIVENKNAAIFQNVKVFAADPWYVAQPGSVKDLSIKTNEENPWAEMFKLSTEFELTKNKILTTIPRLAKEWVVELSFKPTNLQFRGWTSILHMTKGGNNGSYGDRIPAVFYHPNVGLHIRSAVNNNRNFGFNIPALKVGEWTRIRVSQELLNKKLRFRAIIDGVEKFNVENRNAAIFQNVKVFAADPWYEAQPGSVKDLSIKTKEE